MQFCKSKNLTKSQNGGVKTGLAATPKNIFCIEADLFLVGRLYSSAHLLALNKLVIFMSTALHILCLSSSGAITKWNADSSTPEMPQINIYG